MNKMLIVGLLLGLAHAPAMSTDMQKLMQDAQPAVAPQLSSAKAPVLEFSYSGRVYSYEQDAQASLRRAARAFEQSGYKVVGAELVSVGVSWSYRIAYNAPAPARIESYTSSLQWPTREDALFASSDWLDSMRSEPGTLVVVDLNAEAVPCGGWGFVVSFFGTRPQANRIERSKTAYSFSQEASSAMSEAVAVLQAAGKTVAETSVRVASGGWIYEIAFHD